MSNLTKLVKKNEMLLGMGVLIGVYHYSWYVMQHTTGTGERDKTVPWIRVSWSTHCHN